ncbi:MAG: HD domain-containing protein [Acidobacteriia bacterium]|nr:HD domain-containing protein [Terriglobia bacterium]
MSKKLLTPTRLPILYLILGVLILVSVVPMYFYAGQVMTINRERLKTNEMVLQNTITQSLGQDIDHRERNLEIMLANLASAIQVTSGSDLREEHVNTPELRALLEKFVSSSPDVAYATLLNPEAKGISTGRVAPDDFFRKELERAFIAAGQGRAYTGQALSLEAGRDRRIVVLFSTPMMAGGRFIGMLGAAVDLSFLTGRLREAARGGLVTYVVDRQGRLVLGAIPNYATGQDMTKFEIVKNFLEAGGKARLVATREFTVYLPNGQRVPMLGTYSPVPSLEWAVIAQKPQHEAYSDIIEMQSQALWYAICAVALAIVVSVFAARRITGPLDILTDSSRAIARGDFSQRVHLTSRTEFGELAQTFNHMTEDLERFVADLKRAAEENRALFMGSIQMLAGAVDEKDPYTRGHSDRVTRYSTILATEMGFSDEQIEIVRVSAQLHDVGKIGIEDRILKKPGALTPEEYEIMKTHTTRGANILRPVQQLKEMIPGIELHHESLDGRGYPLGLKGDELPLVPRIISVADTFDAMTTNRPYQEARPPEYVVKIIKSLAETKFDPKVVAALERVFQRGDLHLRRAAVPDEKIVAAAAAEATGQISVETTSS